MQNVTFDLPQQKWATLKSKYQPETKYVTSDEFTAGSYNFLTSIDGSITKRPNDVIYNASALAAVGKDQFEAIFTNGVHHLLAMVAGTLDYSTGDGVVSTAKSGFTANANMEYSMYQNRVYLDNGIDNAHVYDLTTSYGGVSYTFPTGTIKEMGCQPPVAAPTFAADSGTGLTGSYHYKVTFLYYGFEESNGSPASTLHTVADKTINLTAVPIGGYGVTARKIYRDANDGNYVLVGTISDNTTTTYADSLSSGTTAIPTVNDLPPVFSYIALNLSRLWVAGISGTPTTLYWSSPGLPDIFDPSNFVVCNPKDPIKGICVYQGTTYVLNRHSFGRILGSTDDTFFYDEFPGSVGCVDSRSIQIRTINGVPTLLWLSDRGVYSFNGSSIEYISDAIEDIVNLNIQQVNFVSNSNNQSTLADFQAGTSSGGIDLLANPGTITTYPTTADFQSQANWEAGSSLVNVATKDGTNTIKVPTVFTPTFISGTLGGAATISGSNVVLPTVSDYTGQDVTGRNAKYGNLSGFSSSFIVAGAYSFTVPLSGAVSAAQFRVATTITGTLKVKVTIWSDVLGSPNAVLYQGSEQSLVNSGGPNYFDVSDTLTSANLVGGTTYWIGILSTTVTLPDGFGTPYQRQAGDFSPYFPVTFTSGNFKMFNGQSGLWQVPTGVMVTDSDSGTQTLADYTFVQAAIASSGTWASAVYDSKSASAVSDATVNTGSYPNGNTSAVLYVDASDDATMSTGVTTFSQANPNGTYNPALSNKRYWRLRYDVATTDNRATPSVTVPNLTFNGTGTWISSVIDCTADVTAYNAITHTEDVPAGTTVTITVATSTDNVSYSAYVAVGSAVVARYVKVKVVLTTTSDNANTPSMSFLRFSWNLQSTFTSSIINTGQVPSGWGLFQDVAAVGAGTVAFYMRSAASSGAIPSATFHAVSNGAFPDVAILPLQFTQWKVVLTTAPGTLPTADSVTINWFLGNNQSPIRTASLFYDKTYYLAAAENNQTVNNIVIVYDQEGNWRLFRGLNINSLGLFFNQPFYLDAVRPNIYQWLVPANGMGTEITMDVRTKAFDLNEPLKLKNIRSLVVTGINTGTTIHAYYSVDRGTTWFEMLNSSGVVGYTTSTNLSKFNEYFVPNYDAGSSVSGVTVMFRVTSTDAFPCSVLTLKPDIVVRSGKYLGRPV